MDEPTLPSSAKQFTKCLLDLRTRRRKRQASRRAMPVRRKSLNQQERAEVLKKTAGKCHICGGPVDHKWEVDHVLSHNDGGSQAVDNYLAAHSLCNNYKWDYSASEFQWVLKIGVWARRQMESNSRLGSELARRFFDYELRRQGRRRR